MTYQAIRICQNPSCRRLMHAFRKGRPRKFCSDACRSAVQRAKKIDTEFAKYDPGYRGSAAPQSVKNTKEKSMACKGENGGRPIHVMARPAIPTGLWEIETGLPAPPTGKMTVLDLKTRTVTFIDQTTSHPDEAANDNSVNPIKIAA
ncbi:MAG TPA: hypothetical protein VGM76_02175 [Lacipirellulaceae bacterium]